MYTLTATVRHGNLQWSMTYSARYIEDVVAAMTASNPYVTTFAERVATSNMIHAAARDIVRGDGDGVDLEYGWCDYRLTYAPLV